MKRRRKKREKTCGRERSGEKKGNGKERKKEKRIAKCLRRREAAGSRSQTEASPSSRRPEITRARIRGKFARQLFYIEIRSCRNAPRGTVSAPVHSGTKGGRDVCPRGIRKRSRERSIRFFFAREILRLRDDRARSSWPRTAPISG